MQQEGRRRPGERDDRQQQRPPVPVGQERGRGIRSGGHHDEMRVAVTVTENHAGQEAGRPAPFSAHQEQAAEAPDRQHEERHRQQMGPQGDQAFRQLR
ncbi:hypothetical protein SDC9_193659 [bioreactor metagenome]|uniref:Uncharacterized protein n=1 Tax=bioreactor metagenome TaxID=1076179 RepID=A0A645I6R0_9ZZZZ